MAERSDGCSRETLVAPCTRKKRLQRKMTKDYNWIRGGGGDSLIKAGTDVRARASSILGVNFCPGIRFWELNFARALGFWQFWTKKCNI